MSVISVVCVTPKLPVRISAPEIYKRGNRSHSQHFEPNRTHCEANRTHCEVNRTHCEANASSEPLAAPTASVATAALTRVPCALSLHSCRRGSARCASATRKKFCARARHNLCQRRACQHDPHLERRPSTGARPSSPSMSATHAAPSAHSSTTSSSPHLCTPSCPRAPRRSSDRCADVVFGRFLARGAQNRASGICHAP